MSSILETLNDSKKCNPKCISDGFTTLLGLPFFTYEMRVS